MTLPNFTILTTQEVYIDLSRPAMQFVEAALEGHTLEGSIACEVDNFINLLHNLLERSEPEPGNLDLVGD